MRWIATGDTVDVTREELEAIARDNGRKLGRLYVGRLMTFIQVKGGIR